MAKIKDFNILLASAMAVASVTGPAFAQAAAPQSAQVDVPLDPVKHKLAQSIVANVISDEQLNTMMSGMQKMMSSRLLASFIPADKLAQARASDPNFDERMRRIGVIMGDYMKDVMAELGPDMRTLIADSLARRESLSDLQQQAAFFSTPAGRHMFDAYYQVMSDPQYVSLLAGLGQRIAAHAGDLQKRITDAMADLPPPPAPAQPPK